MTKPKYRLSKIRLDEISIVDAGACSEATVTIFKRADRDNGGKPMTDLEKMVAQLAEASAVIASQQAAITKAATDMAAKDAEIAEIRKNVAKQIAKAGEPDDEDAILKAADPLVAAEIVKLRKANAAAAKQLADIAEDGEIRKVAVMVGTDLKGLPVKASDFAPILKRAMGTLDDADSKELLRVLKAASNAVEDAMRSTGLPPHLVRKGNAESEIERMAHEKKKADGVTFAKAYDDVLQANPALYSRFLAERDQAMN